MHTFAPVAPRIPVCFIQNLGHDRAAGFQIPQHWRHGIPDHLVFAIRKWPGMTHQLPAALKAINHLVTEAFSQCREMGSLFRAPLDEEAAIGE